ncbi:MAG: ParA family protein [Saprospiraceae bacterium]
MSKIIIFANQKGGVGKSTCTLLAANALSQAPFENSVFIVDADKQRSIARRRMADLQVYDEESPYQVQQMTVKDFLNEKTGIYKLDNDYDYVFIDVPGKLDNNLPIGQQEITKYLQFVDYLFIPFVPGAFQMDATMDFLKIAMKVKSQRKGKGRDLNIYGFINLFEQRTLDDKFLLEEIEELQTMINVGFMENKLNRYALYRNTNTLISFYEKEPKVKAEKNFKNWFTEFNKIIR